VVFHEPSSNYTNFQEDSSNEVGGSNIAGVGWAEGSTRDVIPCGGVIRREFSAHCTILDMPGR
jgi:hypothetical protein